MWTIFIKKQIPEKLKSYFNGAILRFVIRASETVWAPAELIVSQGSYKEFTQEAVKPESAASNADLSSASQGSAPSCCCFWS